MKCYSRSKEDFREILYTKYFTMEEIVYENGALGVGEQVTDYLLAEGFEDNLPKLVKQDDVIYEYTIPASDIEWQLTEETCEIHGYTCTKACARFEGRNWEVWFTLEVPISEGPWLLRGLPGLILRAEDSEGDFCFEMEGIAKHSEEIRIYRWSTKCITKKQWLKYERNALENPYSQFSQGGQVKFFNSNGMKELKDEWSLPYYPIYK